MDDPIILRGLDKIDEIQSSLDWKPFRDGVDIYPLYHFADGKPAAALLRYKAGASVPTHKHIGFEHILVLSGTQQDERSVYEKGALMINPPESQHTVHSETGCIVLAIWQTSVEFIA